MHQTTKDTFIGCYCDNQLKEMLEQYANYDQSTVSRSIRVILKDYLQNWKGGDHV